MRPKRSFCVWILALGVGEAKWATVLVLLALVLFLFWSAARLLMVARRRVRHRLPSKADLGSVADPQSDQWANENTSQDSSMANSVVTEEAVNGCDVDAKEHELGGVTVGSGLECIEMHKGYIVVQQQPLIPIDDPPDSS